MENISDNDEETIDEKEIKYYEDKYGKLNEFEEKNKAKMLFRYRSKIFFNVEKINYLAFSQKDISNAIFFKNGKDDYINFLTNIFNQNYAIYKNKPHVFVSSVKNKKNNELREYVSIDIYYLFCHFYQKIQNSDKESFFQYIFKNREVCLENINIFLSSINKELNKNLFTNEKESYVFDAVNTFNSQTIKTKIANININFLQELMEKQSELKSNYILLKNDLNEKLSPYKFGQGAVNFTADVEYDVETFFRKDSDEILESL